MLYILTLPRKRNDFRTLLGIGMGPCRWEMLRTISMQWYQFRRPGAACEELVKLRYSDVTFRWTDHVMFEYWEQRCYKNNAGSTSRCYTGLYTASARPRDAKAGLSLHSGTRRTEINRLCWCSVSECFIETDSPICLTILGKFVLRQRDKGEIRIMKGRAGGHVQLGAGKRISRIIRISNSSKYTCL